MTINLNLSAAERAAKGATLLDTKFPGWAHKIDRKWLELGDTDHCVVTQVMGGYNDGVAKIGLNSDDQYVYGFQPKCIYFDDNGDLADVPMDEIEADEIALNTAWIDQINQRLEVAA
jgi:hypothetical protein